MRLTVQIDEVGKERRVKVYRDIGAIGQEHSPRRKLEYVTTTIVENAHSITTTVVEDTHVDIDRPDSCPERWFIDIYL
jgi:hypothetical protein